MDIDFEFLPIRQCLYTAVSTIPVCMKFNVICWYFFLFIHFCVQLRLYTQTTEMHNNVNKMVCTLRYTNQPKHDKTNTMTFAPSENSDQPGHPPSLIRLFAVRLKEFWVLSYPLSAQRRLIRLGGCTGWSESLPGTHIISLVLSC